MGLSEIKMFLHSRANRQPTQWAKTFTSYAFSKELIFGITEIKSHGRKIVKQQVGQGNEQTGLQWNQMAGNYF